MRAVVVPEPGGPEALTIVELSDPVAGPGEVVVDVAAAGVNRADLLQRQGFYPPPPGASNVLGLECSGTIASIGDDVTGWQVGDQVCALLSAGGYAEKVVVPAGQLLPVPEGVSLIEAAALAEVACTVWSNVFMVASLQPGELLLAHGGAGGIGTMAIQLGKAFGAKVATTVGSAAKAEFVTDLGADVVINYSDSDFVEIIKDLGGADVILDNMGAAYLARNVTALATRGRLVIIGMQGGVKAELNIAALLNKRAAVIATSLRSRPGGEKAAICAAVTEHVWPLVSQGVVRPIIHRTYHLDEVALAHAAMEAGEHTGKLLLTIS
ncbi:MAG: NAD(P)H-quinone oxidoreductase [Nocardioidaceae bacterium]|nr:MAG: NAD(P)H-quinone oxidoreductase [Nocardioidaceae bacterium]